MRENPQDLKAWGVEMAIDAIIATLHAARETDDIEERRRIIAELAPQIMDYTWPKNRGYVANEGRVETDDVNTV